MDIVSVALKRYSTKAFDATKKLTAGAAYRRRSTARLAPTPSRGTFIVASTDEGESSRGESRQRHLRVQRTYHLARGGVLRETAMDDAWLQRGGSKRPMAVSPPWTQKPLTTVRTFFADMHRKELKDDGSVDGETGVSQRRYFLLGVAAMVSTPCRSGRGRFAILDEEFDLESQEPARWWSWSATIRWKISNRYPAERLPQSTTITEI